MVQLTKLEATDFKGIQSASLEPGELNIITGRNNAGKTSLMEAIAVLSDPTALEDFGSHATEVVNQQGEEALLSGEYWREQLSFEQYDESGTPSKPLSQSVHIRHARDEEVYDAAIKKIRQDIPGETTRVSPFALQTSDLYIAKGARSSDRSEEETLAKILHEVLTDALLSLPKQEIIDRLSTDILAVEIEDRKRYLISTSEEYQNILQQISKTGAENLLDDDRIVSEASENEPEFKSLFRITRSVFPPRRQRVAQFIGQSPPVVSGIHYVDKIPTDPNDIDFEGNSVRVNRIENYLQDHEIVDSLEDFSFTDLVFQEGENPPYDVPFKFMGEGFKVIVGILWELFDESNGGDVLLIEEPEQHMHPGYIEQLTRTLIQIAQDEQLQLFITTHNTDFLESFVSKEVQNQYGKYLQESFQLLQLTDPMHRSLSYEDAIEDMQKLNLDLRGP